MKKISDKQYAEYLEFKEAQAHGRLLMPDTVRFICAANNYDAEQIGRYFLDVLAQHTDIEKPYRHYLFILRDYLYSYCKTSSQSQLHEVEKRIAGKSYSIEEHIKGMIYSLLSNQVNWSRIDPHLAQIDQLFFNYDPTLILSKPASYFYDGIMRIKCGNRSIKAQMEALHKNINTLLDIEREYGSVDAFVISEPIHDIVKKLSSEKSKYKLNQMAEALVWEYLRNVGVDGAKPDTHLRRFLGSSRMGTCEHSVATLKELDIQISGLCEATGLRPIEVDYIIWNFCAEGFGEVCTKSPRCSICPVRNECNYSHKGN